MDAVFRRLKLSAYLVLSVIAVTACGGGGGGSDDGDNNSPPAWQQGVFQPASNFANQCSSVLPQNNFLRSFSNDTYLWYDEITDRNPANYSDPEDYFDLLVTDEITPSGSKKDNFHFTVPTEEWEQQSESGIVMGYGFQWTVLDQRADRVYAVYSDQDNWPAGVERGMRVVRIDDLYMSQVAQADLDFLNEALWPSEAQSHEFEFVRQDGTSYTTVLTAGTIVTDPVQNVQVLDGPGGERVGYLLFHDHNAPAEKELKEAVEQLTAGDGIEELVLDLRYNGGGFLAIASQLAYMIAGDERTGTEWDGTEWIGSSKIFEDLKFNDKHPDRDPITNEPLEPLPFIPVTIGLSSLAENQPLPVLDLERVFVLAGPGTCSASEAIINGLRGVGVEVVLIGEQTCGKPYGYYPQGNCGTHYFTIQFKGVNDKGFGEYSDGFVPSSSDDGFALVQGCDVSDDFFHALGDTGERRLAAALNYVGAGSCGAFATSYAGLRTRVARAAGEVRISGPEWRQNRIVMLPRLDGREVKR